MPVKDPARWLARKLPLVLLLMVLALLRAERGVAELKGTAGEPSRLFRLGPGADNGSWALSVLGHDVQMSSPFDLVETDTLTEWGERALDEFERIKEALP